MGISGKPDVEKLRIKEHQIWVQYILQEYTEPHRELLATILTSGHPRSCM
jgi:hypothetical protein